MVSDLDKSHSAPTTSLVGVDSTGITQSYINCNGDALNTYVTGGIVTTRGDVLQASHTFTTTASDTTQNAFIFATKYYSLQVTATGVVTAWDIRVEASNDNVTWTQILQHTNADLTGTLKFGTQAYPSNYIRMRCAGLTLGLGTNVVCVVMGTQ